MLTLAVTPAGVSIGLGYMFLIVAGLITAAVLLKREISKHLSDKPRAIDSAIPKDSYDVVKRLKILENAYSHLAATEGWLSEEVLNARSELKDLREKYRLVSAALAKVYGKKGV